MTAVTTSEAVRPTPAPLYVPPTPIQQRALRFSTFIDPVKIAAAQVAIIGVGAIGRQVALQLASMGIGTLRLFDPDEIDEVNLGTQGWSAKDLGLPKVQVLGEQLRELNPAATVEMIEGRGDITSSIAPVVFACVDSMEARHRIWQRNKGARLFVDSRVALHLGRIVALDYAHMNDYEATWYPDENALQQACTQRMTPFMANIAAGVAVYQLARHLRDEPVRSDIIISLPVYEMSDEFSGLGLTPEAEEALATADEAYA